MDKEDAFHAASHADFVKLLAHPLKPGRHRRILFKKRLLSTECIIRQRVPGHGTNSYSMDASKTSCVQNLQIYGAGHLILLRVVLRFERCRIARPSRPARLHLGGHLSWSSSEVSVKNTPQTINIRYRRRSRIKRLCFSLFQRSPLAAPPS